MPSIQQIKSKSLRERTLDMLREAILSAELRPGESLVETELAKQLGVSRAPIREALQILDKEGLVAIVPYHGTTVRRMTRTDIEELYSMRQLLECFALRRMMAQQRPEHVQTLRAHYEAMLVAGQANDMKQVNELDRVFHNDLIDMSGHSLLITMWQAVAMRVQQVMALRNRRNADMSQIARNHLPIIEAIEAGDVETAVTLLQAHIASTGDLIAESWDTQEFSPASDGHQPESEDFERE